MTDELPAKAAPKTLRFFNSVLVAIVSFLACCATILVALWLIPAFHGLSGSPAIVIIVMMLVVSVAGACLVTRWQHRKSSEKSMVFHIILLIVLLSLGFVFSPAPFTYIAMCLIFRYNNIYQPTRTARLS